MQKNPMEDELYGLYPTDSQKLLIMHGAYEMMFDDEYDEEERQNDYEPEEAD